jgi:hypothetical protein
VKLIASHLNLKRNWRKKTPFCEKRRKMAKNDLKISKILDF